MIQIEEESHFIHQRKYSEWTPWNDYFLHAYMLETYTHPYKFISIDSLKGNIYNYLTIFRKFNFIIYNFQSQINRFTLHLALLILLKLATHFYIKFIQWFIYDGNNINSKNNPTQSSMLLLLLALMMLMLTLL